MRNLSTGVRGGTMCLSKAGLAIGSTAAELSIAAPNGAGIDYAIDGVAYHLADDATVVVTATAVQAVDTTCLYLVTLTTAGVLATTKGVEVLTAALAAGTTVLEIPELPADVCQIGLLKVVTVAVTFTGATTDFDASGVTTTYQDLMTLPPQPRLT